MSLFGKLFKSNNRDSKAVKEKRIIIADGEKVELEQEAIEYLDIYEKNLELAQAGDGEAQMAAGAALKEYADNFWYGRNRIDEAMSWLEKAAEKGYGAAYTKLGMYYLRDYYDHQDYDKALSLFRKAEELQDAEGIYRIGEMYQYGDGVGEDEHEAFRYFLRAADLGNGSAMEKAGIAYYEGNIVEQDRAKAFYYLSNAYTACEYHYKNFYYYLAQCYIQGEGTKKCPEKAVEVLESLCRKKNLKRDRKARDLLIYCYENGVGTKVNFKRASELRMEQEKVEKFWDNFE